MLNEHLWPLEFFIISCIFWQLFSHESNIRIGRTTYNMIFIIHMMWSTNFEHWQNNRIVKKLLLQSHHQIWNRKWLKLSKKHDPTAQHASFDLHWQYCIWWLILICKMTYFYLVCFHSNHIKMNINWIITVFYIVPNYIRISLQAV